MAVQVADHGAVRVVTIARPEVRNAIDGPTAASLAQAFRDFDGDPHARAAVLTGAGGTFCAGADLKAIARGEPLRVEATGDAPLGVSRLRLGKPVLAAVEGHAVAGGLELALWCDLRIASKTAVFGVFSRRFGVPLIDGGTWRLPRIVGQGRALDLILTGRPVEAEEALRIGLADRVVPAGAALDAALAIAVQVAAFPQGALRADRLGVLDGWGRGQDDALAAEFARGAEVVDSGETEAGARRFSAGAGRHGAADVSP